jgi:hypothetical protein
VTIDAPETSLSFRMLWKVHSAPMTDAADDQAPTIDELRACGWSGVLAKCDVPDCSRYSSALFSAATAAKEKSEFGAYRALRFLGHLTSMALSLDTPATPLVAYARMGTSRTAALEDFDAAALQAVREFRHDVQEPELRARLSDVLWLGMRDHAAAADAPPAYLAAAHALFTDHWTVAIKRVERAAQIAANIGRSDLFDGAIAAVEQLLAAADPTDGYSAAKLMQLLLGYRRGDAARCIAIAETAAVAADVAGDVHRATDYLQIKASWERRSGVADAANATLSRIGETWMKAARGAAEATPPSFREAVMRMQRAVEALRKAPGTHDQRREAHRCLLRYQQAALSELKRTEVTRDISELVKRSEALVSGKRLAGDALAALALEYRPLPVTELRKRVEEQAREHPMQYLFSSVLLTNQGRVAAQRGALLGGTKEEAEAALEAEMLRYAAMHQGLIAQALIEPARRRIIFEHEIREGGLRGLLVQSPFVPDGREALFARGLWAGLNGDFMTSTHVLIPQIEHSVRMLLQQANVPASNLKSDGTQEELDLNTTLRMSQLTPLFGADIQFDLRGLLIEKFGTNLRNRFAHGLMQQHEFQSYEGAYLWYVTLYLCIAPLVLPPREETDWVDQGRAEADGETH